MSESVTNGFDDGEMMDRVSEGDVEAFERIVKRYWPSLRLYAMQMARDSDLAEDLAQEAFARLWRVRYTWIRSGSLRVWLLRTARNAFISHQRKRSVREKWAVRYRTPIAASEATPLRQAEQAELRRAIVRALQALSPRRREAFTLVHVQGLSYKEAASVMAVRPQTIANYLQAAITDLRDELRPHFPFYQQE